MTAVGTWEVEKKSDFNMLELKTANKQTSIFTLWDSGMVYQHQLILEQIDESKLAGMKTTEQDWFKVIFRILERCLVWVY